jgi:hypothetical protein
LVLSTFQIGPRKQFAQSWIWAMILWISAFWVSRITGENHQCSASFTCFEINIIFDWWIIIVVVWMWNTKVLASKAWPHGGVQRWLSHEGSDFSRGLIHWWAGWMGC